jgi:methylmalonyl-CoA mutase N-terminal domain/subunit
MTLTVFRNHEEAEKANFEAYLKMKPKERIAEMQVLRELWSTLTRNWHGSKDPKRRKGLRRVINIIQQA